jgi:membrane-associated phospholipid phosphatase
MFEGKMTRSMNVPQIWLMAFLVCAAAVILSFECLDIPIARWFSTNLGQLNAVSAGLGSAVILSLEATTALTLVVVRLLRGYLSPLNEALALASLTSMCAYAVNDGVLKLLFGVPNPGNVLLQGAHHALHLLAGSKDDSFPSGHMVLAASFAGVFMKLYPRSTWPISALLLFVAAALIVGDWHFASDVIAGTFAGVAAAALAGELWQAHLN